MSEPCEFKEQIAKLIGDVGYIRGKVDAVDKRINGSIDDIHDHIRHGQKWRITIIGVAITVILATIGFARTYGKMETKVDYLYGLSANKK